MANESVVSAVVADLKTKLTAQLVAPTWPRSTVYTFAPVDKNVTLDDCVVLVAGKVEAPMAYATNVRDRNQEMVIPMICQASAVGATAAEDALARADALLSVVVAILRDNPPSGGSVPIIGQRKCVTDKVEFYPWPKDSGGWAVTVFFDLATSVRVA